MENLMQTPAPEEVARLSTTGWIFMLSSLTFVWVLTLWCFRRVLAGPKQVSDPVKDFHSA